MHVIDTTLRKRDFELKAVSVEILSRVVYNFRFLLIKTSFNKHFLMFIILVRVVY